MSCAFALAFFVPSQVESRTINLNCNSSKTLQNAVNRANPGDTINISGTCNESVVIRKRDINITSDGTGAVVGLPGQSAIQIIGGGGIISFLTVTSQAGTPTPGEVPAAIVLVATAAASIEDCTIVGAEFGIVAVGSSLADIKRSDIRGINRSGVLIAQSSSAFLNNLIIHDSGEYGVVISHSSSASLSGNTITSNALDGLLLAHASSVQLDNHDPATSTVNTFSSNGGYGIKCAANSSIGTDFTIQSLADNFSGEFNNDGSCTVVNNSGDPNL